MNIRNICAKALAAVMVGGAVLTPITATAQSNFEKEYKRRQQKKNEWRNLGYGGGAVALYGLLKKDSTLMWAGAAGGLYSAWRYEQDRKSQSRMARDRAALYSKPTVYRNGKRYVRKTVWKNGKKYYQFARG
jgi:hypothetical protein